MQIILVRLQLFNWVLHCTMASSSSSSTAKKSKRVHKALSIEEKVEILDQQHLNLFNLLCVPKKANKMARLQHLKQKHHKT